MINASIAGLFLDGKAGICKAYGYSSGSGMRYHTVYN
jgi:hypothetical protein